MTEASTIATVNSPLDYTLLPLEVWDEIVALLPTSAKRSLLHVSSTFHNIALRKLFSAVRIYTRKSDGSYPHLNPLNNNVTNLHPAWEILDRIRGDQAFADNVRKLVVFAQHSELDPSVAETLSSRIVDTVERLGNLQFLTWSGQWPVPHTKLINALVTFCPALRHLSLPFLDCEISGLSRVHGLQSLSFPPSMLGSKEIRTRTWTWTRSEKQWLELHELLKANLSSLRILEVYITRRYGDLLPLLPKFLSLVDLKLIGTDATFAGQLFRGDMLIQSLTLWMSDFPELFRIMSTSISSDSQPLPLLSSLKLCQPFFGTLRLNASDVDVLSRFIRDRKHFRRLVILLDLAWTNMTPLFQAIGRLKNLEVLGLGLFQDDHDSQAAIALFRQHVPLTITALRISFSRAVPCDMLAQLLIPYQKLRFLSVAFSCPAWSADDLLSKIFPHPSLELFYLDGLYYDIVRTQDSPAPLLLAHRPEGPEYSRDGEYFNEDWEWLNEVL